MRRLNDALVGVSRLAGLRLTRDRPANRFDAMEEVLRGLAARGFNPTQVIDAGANVGQWAEMAAAVFPGVPFHLVEPQPACLDALTAFARHRSATWVYPVAASAPGVSRLPMVGATGGTGAHVRMASENAADVRWLDAATLDDLLLPAVTENDRVLLKLDIEGHELEALAGASRLLERVEVVITEVQFYDVAGSGGPTFSDVHGHRDDAAGSALPSLRHRGPRVQAARRSSSAWRCGLRTPGQRPARGYCMGVTMPAPAAVAPLRRMS